MGILNGSSGWFSTLAPLVATHRAEPPTNVANVAMMIMAAVGEKAIQKECVPGCMDGERRRG